MKGFTLIELLIVIGIIAVVSVVAGFNLYNYKPYQDLDFTVKEIAAVLRNAQSRSMAQEAGGRFGVHFENSLSGENFYDLFQGNDYASGSRVARTSLRRNIQFIDPAAGSSKDIMFSSINGLLATSSTIKVAFKNDNSIFKIITINSNGQVQY